MSKLVQKRNHWSAAVRERAVPRGARGELAVRLHGGAERGQFVFVDRVDPPTDGNDAVGVGELVLEVEAVSVSGLPLYDVMNIVDNCTGPVRIKTVPQGKSKFFGGWGGSDK